MAATQRLPGPRGCRRMTIIHQQRSCLHDNQRPLKMMGRLCGAQIPAAQFCSTNSLLGFGVTEIYLQQQHSQHYNPETVLAYVLTKVTKKSNYLITNA